MPKTRISCPNCRQPIPADVDQLIDVGADPGLKQRFLSGGINSISCSLCGYQGTLSTLLVYHDPDKELLLTFVPPEMGLPRNEQERIIGGFINQAINRLPQEKRKGYLLRPQQTLTYQGLVERVLEGEGITKEMIEAQQKRLLLLQRLLETSPDGLSEIARQEDANLDADFFILLRRLVESAMMSDERESAEKLASLQSALLPITTFGRIAQEKTKEYETVIKALQKEGDRLTKEKLLDLVIKAPNEIQVEAFVSFARPFMDYSFFQLLSEKIEKARGDGRTRLVELRERLLFLTSQVDKEMESRRNEARKLLNLILESKDIREATIQSIQQLDDYFENELNRELDVARKNGDLTRIGRLQEILTVIQEANAPPEEVKLIEELVSCESEEEMVKKLSEHSEEITPEFLEILNGFVNQLQNDQNQQELAQRVQFLYRLAIRFSMARNLRQ